MVLHPQGSRKLARVLGGDPGCTPSFGDLQGAICVKALSVAGCSEFARCLALRFPEAAERIEDSDVGVLHLEVGALRLETRDAIAKRDWDAVAAHYAFVLEMLGAADAELCDALCVSYLGNLFYGEVSLNYAKARSLLPKRLAAALAGVEGHYENADRELGWAC